MKTWWKEIRAVGLWDWVWFVWFLGRDEFSRKLDVYNYSFDAAGSNKCYKDRQRAHRIDLVLMELNTKRDLETVNLDRVKQLMREHNAETIKSIAELNKK